ncbi:MAG: hypothetical protein WB564_00740 [Dehalococcoidia bacterium]
MTRKIITQCYKYVREQRIGCWAMTRGRDIANVVDEYQLLTNREVTPSLEKGDCPQHH